MALHLLSWSCHPLTSHWSLYSLGSRHTLLLLNGHRYPCLLPSHATCGFPYLGHLNMLFPYLGPPCFPISKIQLVLKDQCKYYFELYGSWFPQKLYSVLLWCFAWSPSYVVAFLFSVTAMRSGTSSRDLLQLEFLKHFVSSIHGRFPNLASLGLHGKNL